MLAIAFFMGLARGVIIRAAVENGLLGVLGMESGCDGVAEVGSWYIIGGVVITVSEFISTGSLLVNNQMVYSFSTIFVLNLF